MDQNQAKQGMVVRADFRGDKVGVILDVADPRAWTDTLAFPGRAPGADEVAAHLKDCRERGLTFAGTVPVRWCFGRVYWEHTANLSAVATQDQLDRALEWTNEHHARAEGPAWERDLSAALDEIIALDKAADASEAAYAPTA